MSLVAGLFTPVFYASACAVNSERAPLLSLHQVYTVLVLAGDAPRTVEVKGAVQEVALKPGASLTWVLLPIKAGTYPLECSVKGHAGAGMVGTITVQRA